MHRLWARCINVAGMAVDTIAPLTGTHSMEAERINAIGNRLDDIAQRGNELRRYL